MSITVKDLARMTGLSKGTVDRVLHNRGEVSRKSYEKVMKAVRDSGYEPNIYASLLAKGGKGEIVILLPGCNKGEFWELCNPGIVRGAEEVGNLGISVREVKYDQYDQDAFRAACDLILEQKPSGVVLAPMFKNATLSFVEKLQEEGIPYVFIDSKIECDGYLAYYGIPSYRSGYLCAALLTDDRDVKGLGVVRVLRDKHGQSDPTVNRREGFLDYVSEYFPDLTPAGVFINPGDPEGIIATLDAFLKENPDLSHIAMLNSRVYLLTPWLEKHTDRHFRVAGFDNLEANLAALKSGAVTTLITQRPDEQVYNAIKAIANLLIFNRKSEVRDNFLHMGILTRYNAD